MERHQHVMVKILSHLGQVWVWASHKPELLTTNMMVSIGNVPPLGTRWYLLPLIAFKKFLVSKYNNRSVVLNFGIFQGSFGHFYTITGFYRHFMCIIQIWTTCTCSSAYWFKNQICVLGCILRSHVRNGNECQTPCHHHSAARDTWFLNSSKSKTCLKFMKLGILSSSGINMSW